MLFNTLSFLLLFLPLVLGLALLIRGNVLLLLLAGASCAFYALAGHPWFLIPMAVTTTLDFGVGHLLEREQSERRRKVYLALSLTANLGLLAYFKYSGLLVRTATDALATLGVESASRWTLFSSVILPAGISFYTFQTISYVFDIYRRKAHAEKNFLKYLTFVSFFPHLVAGPLTRHNQLIPQLSTISERGIRPRWRAGLLLFAVGLCKKVLIADRIAVGIDPIINMIGSQGMVTAWLALLGYALQIYFDFSGYSDMAIGLGRLFNIELPQNFNSPYQSPNPSEFWRRWHITLGLWLRDYLYIPLGGNRLGSQRTTVNLMATMILGGLWHGASWSFALWGFIHGTLLVAHHRCQDTWDSWPVSVQRGVTFAGVCLAWVPFRARTIQEAFGWYGALFGVNGAYVGAVSPILVGYVLIGLLVALQLRNAYRGTLERFSPLRAALLGVGTAIAVVRMGTSSSFLYYRF